MNNKNFFKKLNGLDVFILEDGRFEAKIGQKIVTRTSLRDLEKEIGKTSSALTVYEVSRYSSGPVRPVKREIVQFERDKRHYGYRARHKDGSLDRGLDTYYLISDKGLELVEKLLQEREALEEKWKELIKSFTRVDDENFEELRVKASPGYEEGSIADRVSKKAEADRLKK